MRKLGIGLIVLSVSFVANGHNTRKPELFTSYFTVATPVSQAYIPTPTCRVMIAEADKIVAAPGGLKSVGKQDLETASLNLRACATSGLARPDRDLAVGLYGEVVSETERRERSRE